jgi:dTDP-4-amino-4,6-dideoxygalactose transaminase
VDEILRGVRQILESGRLVLGPHTAEFEERFGSYVGVPHAVALSSCMAALQIAFRFLGVRGREVVVSANDFPGVVSAVLYEGGTPILAEMDPSTFCLDVEDALERVTSNTAGIVATHISGLVCPAIDVLREACRERNLFLIEDASHAHGASIGKRRAGSLSDVGCFSFYATKVMTTGTGGMLTTRNSALASYARSVRHHGQGTRRNEFTSMGSDWCLGEVNALLGLQQLRRLDESVEHRNRVVTWYREGLRNVDWIAIPTHPANFRHAYYRFPVLLRGDLDARRFREILELEFGVENGTLYDPPCHLQPAFRERLGHGEGAFPRTEGALNRQVCPPVYPSLSRAEVDRVVEAMHAAARRSGAG